MLEVEGLLFQKNRTLSFLGLARAKSSINSGVMVRRSWNRLSGQIAIVRSGREQIDIEGKKRGGSIKTHVP